MKVSNRVVAVLASLVVSVSFACAAGNKDADKSGKVSLELFSNKPESISTLQGLIGRFPEGKSEHRRYADGSAPGRDRAHDAPFEE